MDRYTRWYDRRSATASRSIQQARFPGPPEGYMPKVSSPFTLSFQFQIKTVDRHFLRREKLNYLELVSVLKLSTMWEFEDVRKLAIGQLANIDIDPVNRLELIRMYDVPQWYWTAIRALCEQTNRLDDF
jgi:hypothetical protein